MTKTGKQQSLILRFLPFLILTATDVLCLTLADCTAFDGRAVARCIKPFLVPSLALGTFLCSRAGAIRKDNITAMLLAMLFYTAGDVLLIPDGTVYFLLGMAAFLIGHVFYLYLMWKWLSRTGPLWKTATIVLIVAVAVALISPFKLKGPLAAAPTLYAVAVFALAGVSLSALIKGHRSALRSMLGGILYCISDSLIAINAFAGLNFPFRNAATMLTYLAAQALLVSAFIEKRGQTVSN